MLRVAFAGTPDFAVPTLRALAHSPHTLVGVLTRPDRPAGRGREFKASPVKRLALELKLPLAQPAGLQQPEAHALLGDWAPDALVVVAYGLILPPALLALPRLGCINIHASLLPRWRGAAPIQRAILAGDGETGITIMQIEAGLDTGPVLAQQRIPIEAATNSQQLHDELAQLGADLLLATLQLAEDGQLRPKPQPDQGVTYAAKRLTARCALSLPGRWPRPCGTASSCASGTRARSPTPALPARTMILRSLAISSVLRTTNCWCSAARGGSR
jgi:methionyl-tRNA formyltransferase